MKRIAIVSKNIGVGGVEKALISMLHDIDYSKFCVDLFLPEIVKDNFLPAEINIKIFENALNIQEFKYSMVHPIQMFNGVFSLLKNRFLKSRKYIDELKEKKFLYKRNLEKYYVVISYDGPLGFSTFYSLYNLQADKKKIWIHGNIIQDRIPQNIIKDYYSQFDEMIFVSKMIREEFLFYYPEYSEKSKVYYNHINEEKIKKLANQEEVKKNKKLEILTVARISYEKGIDIAIECGKILKDTGVDFIWYICGTGVLFKEMKQKSYELHVDENFVFLGEKENPYPYMKSCDIYVQPSRTEGFCTTTNEARILGKAIVTTDVGGMREQFVDRESALITKVDGQSLSRAILELVDKPILKMHLEKNNRTSSSKLNTITIDEILS